MSEWTGKKGLFVIVTTIINFTIEFTAQVDFGLKIVKIVKILIFFFKTINKLLEHLGTFQKHDRLKKIIRIININKNGNVYGKLLSNSHRLATVTLLVSFSHLTGSFLQFQNLKVKKIFKIYKKEKKVVNTRHIACF